MQHDFVRRPQGDMFGPDFVCRECGLEASMYYVGCGHFVMMRAGGGGKAHEFCEEDMAADVMES